MAVAVQSILDQVRRILQDQDGTRWTDDELVDWVNAAQHQIVLLKPDAKSVNHDLTLVTGVLQTLPTGAVTLLRVNRNNSGSSKRAVRLIDKTILDSEIPDWPNATPAQAIVHYMFDESDPIHFEVYPPAASGAALNLLYSAAPAIVTSTDNLDLPDVYMNPVVDYVLARSFSKEADYAKDLARAQNHMNLFMQALGLKTQVEKSEDPNGKR